MWKIGSLYKKLGKDGVLRRCVPSMKRVALLEEAHEDEADRHMIGEVIAKKLHRTGYWCGILFEDSQERVKT